MTQVLSWMISSMIARDQDHHAAHGHDQQRLKQGGQRHRPALVSKNEMDATSNEKAAGLSE